VGASAKNFGKTIIRVFQNEFFPHPETEEPVPYLKKVASSGHVVLNTPLDRNRVPYPGGGMGSSITLPNTSSDRNIHKIVIPRLRNRGVCPDLLSNCFLQLSKEIEWDYRAFDYTSLPSVGSLVQAKPTPWMSEELAQGSSGLELHPFSRNSDQLLLVGEWGYDLNGVLYLNSLIRNPRTGETSTVPSWIACHHRDWVFETVSSGKEEEQPPPAPVAPFEPEPKPDPEALAAQKEALRQLLEERLSEVLDETFSESS
jgi:hypothetical protein